MKTFLLAILAAAPAAPLHAVILLRADLTPDQVIPIGDAPSPAGISSASATAHFILDLNGISPTLAYTISFQGLSVATDIQAVHFHLGHPQPGPSPLPGPPGLKHADAEENGPHVLNVFGLPREDDADLVVDPLTNTISGVWDNSDWNYGPDGILDRGDSVQLAPMIPDLLLGEIYVQVHTFDFPVPDTGELRGQIVVVPEPGIAVLLTVPGLLALGRRRRSNVRVDWPP